MRAVKKVARIELEKCTGCGICQGVCPVLAVKVVQRRARVNEEQCLGCALCEQRCPEYAVEMVLRREPLTVGVDPGKFPRAEIEAICRAADLHPKQVICYCHRIRAEEVAAAILDGAATPEEVSAKTGVRTGCGILCINSVLRLLRGAGVMLTRAPGFQWYGMAINLAKIPEEVKAKYERYGYHIDDDIRIMSRIPLEGGEKDV